MKSPLIIAAALTAGAIALTAPALAATRTVDLPAFDRIDASRGVEVNVAVGGAQSVSAENKDGDFDDLVLEVKHGVLRATRKERAFNFRRGPNYTITVRMPTLVGLEVSSGAETNVTGVKANAFSIDASSGAEANVAGTCERLNADASSGAEIDASDLICAVVDVDVSSGADADVHATKSVTADASSGGSAKVHGSPKEVDADKSSGGSVRMAH